VTRTETYFTLTTCVESGLVVLVVAGGGIRDGLTAFQRRRPVMTLTSVMMCASNWRMGLRVQQ